jgi:hypothetical protein
MKKQTENTAAVARSIMAVEAPMKRAVGCQQPEKDDPHCQQTSQQ